MFKSATEERKQETQQDQLLSIGCNTYGQQLNGHTNHVKYGQELLEIVQNIKKKKIREIYSMRYGATVIVHEDGDISVGGYNEYGQLGVGSYDAKIKQIHHLDFKVKLVSKGIRSRHLFVIKAK
eukprot:206670_1